jgi:hypothetical protein
LEQVQLVKETTVDHRIQLQLNTAAVEVVVLELLVKVSLVEL